MPTSLKRSQITHTPQITHALSLGAETWPADAATPGVLLARLALKGAEAIDAERKHVISRRLQAAGMFTGQYPEGYLEELREGWPE